jgi:hypothetical protein
VRFTGNSESYINKNFVKGPFTESNDIDKIKEHNAREIGNYGGNKLIQNFVKKFEQKRSF